MAGAWRESKGRFWQRMEQEGRLAEAQAVEDNLLRHGLSRRQVQEQLVALFQPADGTQTRSWETPDSWQHGRKCFRRPKSSPAERYDDDLHWAYEHLGHIRPADAPDPQKRLLLLFAEEKPAEFARKYNRALPGITRRQEEREGDRRRRAAEKKMRRAQAEWERLRPQREEEEKRKWERDRKRLYRARKQQEQEAKELRQQEEKARQEQEKQRQQQEKERREKYLRERREATEAVLRERRRIEGSSRCGEPARNMDWQVEVEARYQPLEPALPADADPDVTGRPEAQAWIAEFEKVNARRRAEAERRAKEALPAAVWQKQKRLEREGQEAVARVAERNEALRARGNRREATMLGESIRNMQAAAERHWIRTGERG